MWDNLPPEKLLQLRIAQADIILCRIFHIAKIVAIILAAVIFLLLLVRVTIRLKHKRGATR